MAMPLALDGTSLVASSSTQTVTASLTTAQANDLIVVGGFALNAVAVNSVSDTAALSWTQRLLFSSTSPTVLFFYYYAFSASALSADAIQVNTSGSTLTTAVAFGLTGVDPVNTLDRKSVV